MNDYTLMDELKPARDAKANALATIKGTGTVVHPGGLSAAFSLAFMGSEGMNTAQYIAAYYALNPTAGGSASGTVLFA